GRGRWRRRVRGRREGAALPPARDPLDQGDGADVRHDCRAHGHRPRLLLRRRARRVALDPMARHAPRARRRRHDVATADPTGGTTMRLSVITRALVVAAAASLLPAVAAVAQAPKLEKFPFRLNWTLYGEHAPFFVAREKGFYAQEGLDVEIQEGSGSTTVSQLVANATSPVAYVDA